MLAPETVRRYRVPAGTTLSSPGLVVRILDWIGRIFDIDAIVGLLAGRGGVQTILDLCMLVGLALLLWAWHDYRKGNRALVSVPASSQNIQQSPGAWQAGRDIVVVDQGASIKERCKNALSSAEAAASEAATALTAAGVDRGRGAFLYHLSEIQGAVEGQPGSDAVLALVADLRGRAPGLRFARPEFAEKLRELRAAAESLPGSNKIEVLIEPDELSHVALVAVYNSSGERIGTELIAALDGVKIINHDQSATKVERMWLEIEGIEPRAYLEISDTDRIILGRNDRVYDNLRARLLFEQHVSGLEVAERILLCVNAIGFGPVCRRLPKELFQQEGANL